VLEFWGHHNHDGNDNYQNVLKFRYYNLLEAGDWCGRIRLDTAWTHNYNLISSAINPSQPALARNLQIFLTIGFELFPDTMLRFGMRAGRSTTQLEEAGFCQ
jgi:hypothetical protein